MINIGNEYFLKGLRKDIESNVETLINKNKVVKMYTDFQVIGSIIGILGFFFYYFLTIGNYSFNGILESYEFYIAVLGLLICNIVLEKVLEQLKKEIKKLKETIKSKMTLKICNCEGYCECKEELNEYMKKNGNKII